MERFFGEKVIKNILSLSLFLNLILFISTFLIASPPSVNK